MRRFSILVGSFTLASMLAVVSCRKKAEADGATGAASASASPGAAVSAAAQPATLRARLGGTLIKLGDTVAEVLLHADGQVELGLMDLRGQLLTEPEASLSVKANTAAGAETNTKLAWDAGRARFVGHAEGDARLASGPVKVDLSLRGKTTQGTLAMVPVVTGPHFGGRLLAVGDLGGEVRATTGGNIAAQLWDAKLEPITAKSGAKVEAKVKMGAGAAETVALHWEEPRAQFEGQAHLSGEIAPVDLELDVDLGGKLSSGAMAGLVLAGEAQHGGVVLEVGDYSAEVLAGANGLVEAFVMDASGKAHAKGDLGVSLEPAGVPAVELRWDAPSASYRAKLAAGVNLSHQPFKLRIESGGRVNVGASAQLKALASADLSAKAKAEADTLALAQGKATAGLRVDPPSLHLTPPKLDANAKASVGTGSGAKADAKAALKAPSLSVKPPSVKAGAAASAKTGAKGGFKIGF